MQHDPMRATPLRAAGEQPAGGATALGSAAHPRHVVGNALRAVRVFGETAFRVVVLGRYDARPTTVPLPHPRGHDRAAA
jgi:hypothetical protein